MDSLDTFFFSAGLILALLIMAVVDGAFGLILLIIILIYLYDKHGGTPPETT